MENIFHHIFIELFLRNDLIKFVQTLQTWCKLWNISSTHLQQFYETSSTIYETILQHIFITYFHNSSTTNYSRLGHKTFIHNLWCNTLSQYFHNLWCNTFTTIHSQFMMQYFITILSQQFIKLFSKTFEHSFHNKLSSIVEILMIDASSLFNISSQHLQQTSHHNIFNKHLITASSTNISSQHLQQTFQQTIIQFFIKTCRWVSYNLFKHHILQHIFTQQMVTDIIHHSPTNLYHNIFHFFITVHDTVLYHIMQTS